MDAQERNGHEAGGPGAHDRPQRVDGVHVADAAPHHVRAAGDDLGHQRKGPAHAQGRRQDHHRGLHESEPERRAPVGVAEPLPPGVETVKHAPEDGDRQQPVDADPHLQRADQRDQVPRLVTEAREEKTPEGEPAEERRQHGAEGVGRVADEEGQGAGPDHLVGQRRTPGHGEAPQDEAHGLAVVHGSRTRRIIRSARKGFGHSRRRPRPPRPDPRHEGDGQVQRRPEPHRLGQAQVAEQHVAGGETAQDGAAGIERVESADAPSERGVALHHVAAQHRQGRAHQRGRDGQQTEGEDEAYRAEEPEGGVQGLMQPDVHRRQRQEDHRQQDGAHANGRLEPGVEGEAGRAAVDVSAAQETAQGQSGHERRQHRAHGEDRVAEQQVQHPRPGHFVEQAADPGHEEQPQHQAAPECFRSWPHRLSARCCAHSSLPGGRHRRLSARNMVRQPRRCQGTPSARAPVRPMRRPNVGA